MCILFLNSYGLWDLIWDGVPRPKIYCRSCPSSPPTSPGFNPTIIQFLSKYLQNIDKSIFEVQWQIFTDVTQGAGICNSHLYYGADSTL